MRIKLIITILCLSLLISAAGCSSKASGGGVGPGNEAVAVLGDNAVPRNDFTLSYLILRMNWEYQAMYSGYDASNIDQFWSQDVGGMSLYDMIVDEALTSAKEIAVLYECAVAAGTKPDDELNKASDDDVNSLLESIGGDEQQFKNNFMMSPQQMKEVNYRMNLIKKYKTDFMESIEISDDELHAVYDADPSAYDQVTARHVLISCDDSMSEEQRDEAKAKADEILQRLKDGEPIGELAAQYSEDPGSKDNNGEYTFGRGVMVSEFEDWAFSAQIGDKGMVQTTYGYHIMELVGRLGFEDAKEEVENSLREDKFYELHESQYSSVDSGDWQIDQAVLGSIVA